MGLYSFPARFKAAARSFTVVIFSLSANKSSRAVYQNFRFARFMRSISESASYWLTAVWLTSANQRQPVIGTLKYVLSYTSYVLNLLTVPIVNNTMLLIILTHYVVRKPSIRGLRCSQRAITDFVRKVAAKYQRLSFSILKRSWNCFLFRKRF